MKEAQEFRRCLLRGLRKVRGEGFLAYLDHNLSNSNAPGSADWPIARRDPRVPSRIKLGVYEFGEVRRLSYRSQGTGQCYEMLRRNCSCLTASKNSGSNATMTTRLS